MRPYTHGENPITYRLRAELSVDVFEFSKALGPKFIGCSMMRVKTDEPKIPRLPDVDALVIVDGLSLDQVRDVLRTVVDGHVMLETIALPKDYTGERNSEVD